MKICFDMDGTIANLYSVNNWLDYLMAYDPTPYEQAPVMLNMNSLARRLNRLQTKGHKIVIISWLSKNSTNDYNNKVIEAKKRWLSTHLRSVSFDEIHIVEYGTNKAQFAESPDDILFDDEINNRKAWTGKAYDVNNILEVLKNI